MAEYYNTNSFELLSPAGSPAILEAVIAAGADAVYVGGSRFGARAYAQNFSEEELCDAIDYVHLRGRKLYLAVNTLMKNSEIDELYDYIRPLYERGLDAVIVQDIGAISLLKRKFPDLPLHASTQMTITGADGARMLKELGICRVVLSRELSIAEIARIHKETGMELEVFVHGALCYSYSGQCLFSSMIGGRSGNRGRCAQPCRLPYQVCGFRQESEEAHNGQNSARRPEESINQRQNGGKWPDESINQCRSGGNRLDESVNCRHSGGEYVLSLKDLCGINDLAALYDAGVFSLKIEGRMKQEEYAAGVTAYYRKYIDRLEMVEKNPFRDNLSITPYTASGIVTSSLSCTARTFSESFAISKRDRQGLLTLGNRCGFTDGYYHKRNGADMVTFTKPSYEKNSGSDFTDDTGRESRKKAGKTENVCFSEINPGNDSERENKIGAENNASKNQGRNNIAYDLSNNKMFVSDKFLIRGWASFHLGEEANLTVIADAEHGRTESPEWVTVSVVGQELQAAAKSPVTAAQIEERLLKTGDTPFEFDELTVDADEGIFIPNGELNRMRREALLQLRKELLAPYRRDLAREAFSLQIPDADNTRNSTVTNDNESDAMHSESEVMHCESETMHSESEAMHCESETMHCESDTILYEPNVNNAVNDIPISDKLHYAPYADGRYDCPRLIAKVSSQKQLEAVLADGRMTDIYIETVVFSRKHLMDELNHDIKMIKEAAPSKKIFETGIYLALPPIFRSHTADFYTGIADDIRKLPIKGFLIRNYEEFAWVGRLFPGYERILDANMYTYNDEASEAFAAMGASGNTVPLELNRKEIMARDNSRSEMIVYGYYPLMVSAQCVHANTAGFEFKNSPVAREVNGGNTGCDGRSGITYMRDRKGVEFPVRNFCSECVNVIYNSLPTSLLAHLDENHAGEFVSCPPRGAYPTPAGIRGFRLDFTIENADEVRKVLQLLPAHSAGNAAAAVSKQRSVGTKSIPKDNGFLHTNGHYTRGVL